MRKGKKFSKDREPKFTELVIEELLEHKNLPKFIFGPNSNLRKFWDMIIGIIMIYVLITTPLLISFIDSKGFDQWFWIDLSINTIFIFDVLLNLNTSYYDEEGVLISSRSKIFKNYLKSWLLIDLFTCIPFEIISITGGSSENFDKISRFRMLPKIFRIARVIKMIKHVKQSSFIVQLQTLLGFSHLYMRILLIFCAILTSIHVISCIWYTSAKSNSFSEDTWVYRFKILDKPLAYRYLCSVYWSITTLISVGYGDITPWTPEEIGITLIWMVFSIYFLSFTVSSLSSLISQIQQKNKLTDNLLVRIDNFSEETDLPKELSSKIKKYVKNNPGKYSGKSDEKRELLELFSFDMKCEIVDNIHGGVYRRFPVISEQSREFVVSILPYMNTQEFNSHEEVYASGSSADEIFFLLKGKINYFHNSYLFRVDSPGVCFGDYEVFKRISREYTVKFAENGYLWIMTRQLIDIIINDFPTAYKQLVSFSVKNFKKIKASLAEIECFREFQGRSTTDMRKSVSERYQTLLKDAANHYYKLNISNMTFESEVDELIEMLKYDSKVLKNIKSKLQEVIMFSTVLSCLNPLPYKLICKI